MTQECSIIPTTLEYALSTELKEVADSIGREGILPVPQISMVRGVGRLHSARVGKCRREACPDEPAPSRLYDLDADKAKGSNPPPAKMDVAIVVGTSSYRDLAPTLPGIKVLTLALPGLDMCKMGEGRKLGGGQKSHGSSKVILGRGGKQKNQGNFFGAVWKCHC